MRAMPDVKKAEAYGYETYKGLIKAIIEDFSTRLGKNGLVACVVFGSVARGEASARSDIDLLFVHDSAVAHPLDLFLRTLRRMEEMPEYRAMEATGFVTWPNAIFRTDEALSVNPLILLDILDDGILVVDKRGYMARKLAVFRARLDELGATKVTVDDGTWYWDLKPDYRPGEVVEISI